MFPASTYFDSSLAPIPIIPELLLTASSNTSARDTAFPLQSLEHFDFSQYITTSLQPDPTIAGFAFSWQDLIFNSHLSLQYPTLALNNDLFLTANLQTYVLPPELPATHTDSGSQRINAKIVKHPLKVSVFLLLYKSYLFIFSASISVKLFVCQIASLFMKCVFLGRIYSVVTYIRVSLAGTDWSLRLVTFTKTYFICQFDINLEKIDNEIMFLLKY